MPLHLDYRPRNLDEVFGNDSLKDSLKSIFSRKDRPRTYLLYGLSGCLRGDTPIYDPLDGTNLSIHNRWERSKPFHVFSYSPFSKKMVIATAQSPVRYYQSEIFRVDIDESSFFVTNEHRFLSEPGEYLSLKELSLKEFSESPLLSISELSPLVQLLSEPRYLKTKLNSQVDYLSESHFYDEQLHFVSRVFLKHLKRAICVLSHNLGCLHLGDLVDELEHILRNQYIFLPSKNNFYLEDFLLSLDQLACLFFEERVLLLKDGRKTFEQSQFVVFLQNTILRLINLARQIISSSYKFLNSSFFHTLPLASLNLLQNNSRISSSPSFIKQIKQESKDFFYDFTVPIYNNYWTKGFIHHNCGKTTIARIIAKMSECSDSDTYEYNSANARGIDTIREISMNMYYAGMFNRNKAYIFDEAHAITSAAKEATLKMLEDTPSHVTFILCTTEPELLPKTIHTRSSSYKVTPLTNEEMRSLIQWVLNSEGTKNFSKNIIEEIIKVADGCPREALVILDQVIDIKEERKALAAINTFVIGEAEVIEICQGIMKGRPWSEMKKKVAIVLKTTESEKLRYAILNYFSTVLLDERGFTKPSDFDRVSSLIDLFSDNTFYSKKAGVINMIYLACK